MEMEEVIGAEITVNGSKDGTLAQLRQAAVANGAKFQKSDLDTLVDIAAPHLSDHANPPLMRPIFKGNGRSLRLWGIQHDGKVIATLPS
ncbi:MAG: hypothetical protein CEN89_359 [Candidatus Berkelbacteria bacterium Licking1014_7]|uniref:Uncharacterized protein n=1 Tax=Candidatus Berkelbacteria bacterium Licking1014_7 TaxID=2017147 RepID=A0A554LJH3_9BACT|nr:MAG: hypothetical protein CEN89_359 [Candidatus Berkelbacteria bacterium Licking1014_7]